MIPAARPEIGQAERAAVDRVLASGMLAQGPEVAAFEQEFSDATVEGIECVAVNSGTSALHLAVVGLGIGPGDEVIVPSFTFAATANCIAFTGATPVFVDIDPETFTIEPAAVESAITARTSAVIPVHLYGHPADLASLSRICDRHGLALVEDAAQAHLAEWAGKRVGSWGSAGAFSFYPTKNMTSGEGGMACTSDRDLAHRLRLLRNQGQARRYENDVVGLNNRMTEIHAAIGRVQLTALASRTLARQENAAFYDQHLSGVVTPLVRNEAVHVYHQYTIRVPGHDRDGFAQELADRGVGTGVYYPTPVHRLPAYALSMNLFATERAVREVLSLPVYPSLTASERDQVAEAVNAVAAAGA